MITRRQLLKGLAAFLAGSAAFGSYALAEPFRLNVTRYRILPPNWPRGLKLRLAVIADIHACEPWMPVERIDGIVARTNALNPDVTLLLGDYVVGRRIGRLGWRIEEDAWAASLAKLKAPLGVHAVLGNHEWWDDRAAQKSRRGPVRSRLALEKHGIAVYENDTVRLEKDGQPFWIAGLGDQWAFFPPHRRSGKRPSEIDPKIIGTDDLAGTLAKVTDAAPVILMAHEPEIFPSVPPRVALTLSGHTHGGQVRLLGYSPIVPSRFGQRFSYGHIVETDKGAEKNLVVSGGLGVSGIPVRFGVPPEIVVVELG